MYLVVSNETMLASNHSVGRAVQFRVGVQPEKIVTKLLFTRQLNNHERLSNLRRVFLQEARTKILFL